MLKRPTQILKKIFYRLSGRTTRPRFGSVGVGFQYNGGYFGCPENIYIGDYVYIGPNAYFAGRGGILIDDGTIFGPRVTIRTSNHRYDGAELRSLPFDDVAVLKSVKIGKNVWIGDLAVICPGVSIGEGVIVGIGAVVSKDVEPLSIVAGNPARVVKKRDPARYAELKKADKIYWKERCAGRMAQETEIRIK